MRSIALAVACLALLAPIASAAPVDLYIHVNGFQDAPMTTAPPGDEYSETVQRGIATHSGCVADPSGAQHFTNQAHHTWYAYQSPTQVLYSDADEKPRIHQMRGVLSNLTFDDVQPVLQWYLAPEAIGQAPYPDTVVIPRVTIEATLRVGDEISVGHQAFNSGELIAHGRSAPIDLYPGASGPGLTTHSVEGKTVYGFRVPMDITRTTIPANEGFNLRIDAYVDQPLCQEGTVMPDWLKVHTSPDLRPKLAVEVKNPLQISAVHPSQSGDDLLLHIEAASALGGADTVVILASPLAFEQLAQSTHGAHYCHGCPEPPAPWIFRLANATSADGTYPIEITVQNLQGTMSVNQTLVLEVKGGAWTACQADGCISSTNSSKGAPGLPLLALIGLLAILARRQG